MALANVFYLKAGDTYPAIYTQLTSEGNPVNLSACTVTFRCSEPNSGNVMITGTAGIVNQSDSDDWGKCYYQWQAGDTDTPGIYRIEWSILFPDGRQATFPRGIVEEVEAEDIYNHLIIQEIVD